MELEDDAWSSRNSHDLREKKRKKRNERFEALKRRVTHLARLDDAALLLEDGVVLVNLREMRNVDRVAATLQFRGTLTRNFFERNATLDSPLLIVDPTLIAEAHHDLRTLAHEDALALLHEHRKWLQRYGSPIDEAWLLKKRQRVDEISALYTFSLTTKRPKEESFNTVLELVRAMRGEKEAARLAEPARRIAARPSERRQEANDRVSVLVAALKTGIAPRAEGLVLALLGQQGTAFPFGKGLVDDDADLPDLHARLEAAFHLPGRARKRRVLDVLRHAVRWSKAPASLVESFAAPASSTKDKTTYAAHVLEAGHAMALALPILRDPQVKDRLFNVLTQLALLFPIGAASVPELTEEDAFRWYGSMHDITELARAGVTMSQAMELAKIPMKSPTRVRIAGWVSEGLEIDLVRQVVEKKHLDNLMQLSDVRSVRAYATWATRLSAHYQAQGITFSLSPELFTHLPKNEDLGVLAMCLMDHADPKSAQSTQASPKSDPIAILDATLALFQKLPKSAKNILTRLRETKSQAGRKLHRAFAEWLDDDALLDRYLHIAKLADAGALAALPRAIREDFEHAERTRGELQHLQSLTTAERSVPQQGRLDALLRAERTLDQSPKGRTKRRITDSINRLLPIAYRRELDVTFREILATAWKIDVPALTPAWRDAVRFLLVADENRNTLTYLLKRAAKNPRVDVKRGVPKNEAWIASVKDQINVDAWLRPRRREFKVTSGESGDTAAGAKKDHRYVIELEEDPLEVLRMGIPFGTCLSLENGVNAAATVYNAIEANKRVFYVRRILPNETRGPVVSRKLVAISKENRLIGYNLYVSIRGGPTEAAIRTAMLAECRALAEEVGVPLASTGEPAKLHNGFWYDDGTVPFEEDVDVDAYCKSIALPAPAKWFEDMGKEARAWRACETGDVEAAIPILSAWDTGPANRALGTWLVDRLGPRAAEKRAREDSSFFVAITRSLTERQGEDGMVRALDLALRLPEFISHHRIWPLLSRFPPSPKIAAALCDIAVRSIKRVPVPTDHGLAHLTMRELPLALGEDVGASFDFLDAIEPAWDHVAKSIEACASCAESAVVRCAAILESRFAYRPDPDVVLACLMSRHRSVAAQRAALRIAASFELPHGDQALVRFAALRPKLAASPTGMAATLRQARVTSVTEKMARKMPTVHHAGPLFEALRELIRIDNLSLVFGKSLDVEKTFSSWTPGVWELAWRRRNHDESLHRVLFEEASATPYTATRAMELLALLGDLDRMKALDRLLADDDVTAPLRHRKEGASKPKKALFHDVPSSCRKTAASIVDQVRADSTHQRDVSVAVVPHADALYVHRAATTLLDDHATEEERDIARIAIADANDKSNAITSWRRLLVQCAARRDHASVIRILDTKIERAMLSPKAIVDVWQLPEARDSLVASLERVSHSAWAAVVLAAEREAAARGLSVDGLLEKLALALAATKDDEVLDVESLDQLRAVATAIVNEASEEDVAIAYSRASDALSAAVFIRAVKRLPNLERASAIREAVKNLKADSDLKRTLVEWMSPPASAPFGSEVSAQPMSGRGLSIPR